MSTYKLVALDMDGTLLDEHSNISKENAKWIHAALEEGVTVMFSTGRGVQSALPFAEELNLKTPIVAVNGSEVWKEPNVLLKRVRMDVELIRKMHEIAVEYDTWFWSYAVEGVFNKEKWTDDITGIEWLKFGYYTEEADKLAAIRKTLESWDVLEITNSHPSNLELNPKGISKASGLNEVCRMLGLDMSQVIAMGDSLNDMAMIRAAGLGIAMGNAQEELKRAAKLVTVTNNESAVARVIREHIFGERV
ncbi:Cof-type HAD-IIB family hydrolase [Paenibacillus sp. MBLB4367]|uniref:Cof-type HAD-IIB family hydrolase n=1 Tax=Paenibacillus sp. MBLB4367 TaxID=3384767 RepID=UPI0039080B85